MLTTSTKRNQKQNISQQLYCIKQLLIHAIPVHIKFPSISSSSPLSSVCHSKQKQYCTNIPAFTVHIPEYKHMKRNQLIQQNAVLAYQVKLLCNLIMKLGIDQSSHIYKLNQSRTNQQIKLAQENTNMHSKILNMEKYISKITQEKSEMETQIANMHKNSQIYRKRMTDIQKVGGITKFHQLKDQINDLQNKEIQYSKTISVQKDEIKKLKQKCKVLEQLNRETQQKLSQALVQINPSQIQNNNKENVNHVNNAKVELMACKEQVRALKQKIEVLTKQKQNLKNKHTEKQSLYQKMIMKKDIKLI